MSQFNEHMQAQYEGRHYLPKITLTKANGIMLELDDSMLVQGSIGLTFSITQGELLTFGNAIASELRFTAFRTQELYDYVKDGVVKITLEMISGEDTFITYQSSIIDPPKISDERIEFTSVDDLAKLDELYVPDVDRPRVFTEGATLLDVLRNVFRVVLPLYTVDLNEADITTDLPVAAISDEVFQEATYREIVRWALEALALNASIHGNTIRLTRFGLEDISITEEVMFDRKISENTYVYTGATLEGPEETFYSSGNKALEYRVEGNPFLLTSGSQAHTDSYLSAISSAGFTPFKVSTLAVFDSSALMSKLTVPDRNGGTITGFITHIETKVDGRSTVECQGLDYVPTVGQLRSSGAVRLRRQEIKSTLNKDIIFESIEAKHKIAMDTYEIEKQERIDAVQNAKTEFTNSLAEMDAILSGTLDPDIPGSLAYQVENHTITIAELTDGDVTAYNQKISTALGDIQTIKDADYAAQISRTSSELSSQIANKASTSELISLINQQAGRVIIGTKSGTTGSVLKITPENIDVDGVVISGGNIEANTISGSHITVDNLLATKLTASSLIADQMWTKYLSTKELSADYLSAGIIQKNGSYWNLNTGDVNLGGILQITNGVSSLDPQKVITTVQDTQQWKDLSGRVSTATQTAEQLTVQFQNNTKANLLPSTFNFTPMPTIYFGGSGSYTRTVTAGDLEIINEGGYYGEETRIAYKLARDVALNGQYFTLSGKFKSDWNMNTRLRFRFPRENAWHYADIQNTDHYHDFSVTWQTNLADGSRVGEIYIQVYNKTQASGTTKAQIKLQGQSLKLEEGRAATPWTRADSEMIRTSSYTFDEKSVRFTYDGQDKLVFDGMTGDLDITGRIHATGGTIGAWGINADGGLVGGKNNVKLSLDPSGVYNPLQYTVGGKNYFSVNVDGSTYSRNARGDRSAGSHSGSGSFTSGSYAGSHSGYGSFSSGSYTGSGYLSSGSTIAGYPITSTTNGIKVERLTCDYLTVKTEIGYGSVRVGSYQLARATSDNNAMWVSSDVRLKEGIADVGDNFNDLIYSLPIISYALKDDKDKQPTLGVNANLVARLYHEEQTKYFIRKDPVTERYEARYTEFIPMLIKTVQDLNERLKKVEGN